MPMGANDVTQDGNQYAYWKSSLERKKKTTESDAIQLPFIDYDKMKEDMGDLIGDVFTGIAPRWYLLGKVRNITEPSLNTTAIVGVINTKEEMDIGLGRDFI